MLTYRNNWCNHEYSVDGVQIVPKLVEIHFNGEDLGTFEVLTKKEHGSYPDHGHTYPYSTVQYFVSVETPFGETCGPSLMELLQKGYEIFTSHPTLC